MLISVAKDHFIESSRIIALIPSNTRPSVNLLTFAKEDNRVINLKGGTVKVKTIAILDTGQVALLPLNPQKAASRLNEGLAPAFNKPLRRGKEYFDEDDVASDDVSMAVGTDLPLGRSIS